MSRCVIMLLTLGGCFATTPSMSTTPAASMTLPCTPGWYANGSVCQACGAGFFQPDAGAGADPEEFYLEHPGNVYFSGVYRRGASVFNGKPTYVSVAHDICWWYVESDYNLWLAYSACDGGLFGWASYTLPEASGLLNAARELQYCKGCEAGSYAGSTGASACATCSTAYARRLSVCPHTTGASTTRELGTIATPVTIWALSSTSGVRTNSTSTAITTSANTTALPTFANTTATTTAATTTTSRPATTTTLVPTSLPVTSTTTSANTTTSRPATTTTLAPTSLPATTTTTAPNNTVMVSVVTMSFSSLNATLVATTQATLASTCANCSVDLLCITYLATITYCNDGADACIRQALGTAARRLLATGVQLTFVVISLSSYEPPDDVCAPPCTDYTLRANTPMRYNASLSMERLALLLVIRDERAPLEINVLAIALVVVIVCLVLTPNAYKIRRATGYQAVQEAGADPVQGVRIDKVDTAKYP